MTAFEDDDMLAPRFWMFEQRIEQIMIDKIIKDALKERKLKLEIIGIGEGRGTNCQPTRNRKKLADLLLSNHQSMLEFHYSDKGDEFFYIHFSRHEGHGWDMITEYSEELEQVVAGVRKFREEFAALVWKKLESCW